MFSRPPEPDPEPEPPSGLLAGLMASVAEAAAEDPLAALSDGLMQMREMHAVLLDAADGMRADLLKRGWSPSAAEHLTLLWTGRLLANITPLAAPGEFA